MFPSGSAADKFQVSEGGMITFRRMFHSPTSTVQAVQKTVSFPTEHCSPRMAVSSAVLHFIHPLLCSQGSTDITIMSSHCNSNEIGGKIVINNFNLTKAVITNLDPSISCYPTHVK